MAEDAAVVAPNVLREEFSTPKRRWTEYLVTAPGRRVITSVTSSMAAVGGFLFGMFVIFALAGSGAPGWLVWVLLVGGVFGGLGYAKLVNLLVGTQGLVRRGKAVRLSDHERNQPVIGAATRQAPGYFTAARRAAELDRLEQVLATDSLTDAERVVRQQEFDDGAAGLRLLLSQASLRHAVALLDPSDPAIRAAGHLTAAIYAELQESRAALDDENL